MKTIITACVLAVTGTYIYSNFRTTDSQHVAREVDAVRLEGREVVIEHKDGAWRLPASQVGSVKPGDVVDLNLKNNKVQGWHRDGIAVVPKESR